MEEKAKRRAMLLDQMRGITQVVRGEFHPHQLDRCLRAVLKRIDKEFADQHGIAGTALFDTLQGLLRIVEGRLNEHRRLCHLVFRRRKPSSRESLFDAFPEEASRRELILADAAAKAVVPELMRYFLVEEAEAFLPRVYTLSASDIAAACPSGADVTAAKRAISAWSLAFGDLKDRPIEHLYLANPVLERPLRGAMVVGRRAFMTFLGCALTSRQIVARQATSPRVVGALMGLEKNDPEAHGPRRGFRTWSPRGGLVSQGEPAHRVSVFWR